MNIKTRIATQCDNLFCGILRVAGYAPTLYNGTIKQSDTMTAATYQADLLSPGTEYNGWTNYETWNVGLWLNGDEGLYDIARRALDYDHLVEMLTCIGSDTTGDGVRWDDPKVNAVEIDEMLRISSMTTFIVWVCVSILIYIFIKNFKNNA